MSELKFYICKHCGNIICYAENKGVPVMCCGEKMQEIVPGSVDAAVEKHVPVANVKGNTVEVTVGSVAHPMTEDHLIQWIAVETKQGTQMKKLSADKEPKAVFALSEGDELVSVYAYCNLHGLWKYSV